ncbi:MAG: hypothetical protein JAY90_18700 [Candidatus Thiodiazotropha lotti]|nr:hypothetical protein [Candidatus Thiodiazotropha lotti]
MKKQTGGNRLLRIKKAGFEPSIINHFGTPPCYKYMGDSFGAKLVESIIYPHRHYVAGADQPAAVDHAD